MASLSANGAGRSGGTENSTESVDDQTEEPERDGKVMETEKEEHNHSTHQNLPGKPSHEPSEETLKTPPPPPPKTPSPQLPKTPPLEPLKKLPPETPKVSAAGPWKVVLKYLVQLREQLDIKSIRDDLWSASLITHNQHQVFGLDVKPNSTHVMDLLMSLISMNQLQDFYTFLTVLHRTGKYQKWAKKLRQEAGKVQMNDEGDRVSRIHPFILVRRCGDKLWDISVQDNAARHLTNCERVHSDLSSTDDQELEKEQQRQQKLKLLSLSEKIRRSEELLQEYVCLPRGCKGHGDTQVVVLAGEILEIVAWLRANEAVSEEELGKVMTPKSDCVDDDTAVGDRPNFEKCFVVSSSGIYCLLSATSSTVYVIVCLRCVDEPEVHTVLLRMAVEMSPMWLIFCNKTEIKANNFCTDADVDPKLVRGWYGPGFVNNRRKDSPCLLAKLRDVYQKNMCKDTCRSREALGMLHIQFVFNVSLAFFSENMVYHSSGQEISEAKCKVLTLERFPSVQPSSQNQATAHLCQEVPDLSMGISLQNRLQSVRVSGYRVDLSWWLQRSMGFVPVVLLSSSVAPTKKNARTPLGVVSNVFPQPQPPASTKWSDTGGRVPPDSRRSALERLSHVESYFQGRSTSKTDKAIAELISNSMDDIKLPAPLHHILNTWRGPVQVVTCIGARQGEALQFLNDLFGSGLSLFTHGEASQRCQESTKHRSMLEPISLTEQTTTDGNPVVEEALEVNHSSPGTKSRADYSCRVFSGELQHQGCSAQDVQLNQDQTGSITATRFPLLEDASGKVHHTHPDHSRLWISCYPTDAILYILLNYDQLSLIGANCTAGIHQSASLVVAAALANAFVVLASKFDEDVDVMRQLLNGLQRYGQLMPDRNNRDAQLFNSFLLPVVVGNTSHKCRTAEGTQCCSQHFKRIWQHLRWMKYADDLHHYFGAVEPLCTKTPVMAVREEINECGRMYESCDAFRRMLRLILATMATRGLEAQPPLTVLKLEHILERPWLDFKGNLLKGLSCGKVGEQQLPSEVKEVHITMTNCKEETCELVWPVADAVLGLMRGEETDMKETKNRLPQLNSSQIKFIDAVRTTISRLYNDHQDATYKLVPPSNLLKILQDTFKALTKQRARGCKAWFTANITNEPFGPEATAQCIKLIDRLEAQWHFCGMPCEEGEDCHYFCCHPTGHSPSIPHSCLDLKGNHQCECMCKFCIREHEDVEHPTKRRRTFKEIEKCTRPAGHQHVEDSETQLHLCGNPHKCERECSLSKARNCKVRLKSAPSWSGSCWKRMDHADPEGMDDPLCLCSVPEKEHLCPKPCDLRKEFGGCRLDRHCCSPIRQNHVHHLCGAEHICRQRCRNGGVCLLSDSATVHGAVQLQKDSNGYRKKCRYKIQAHVVDHADEGSCDCGAQHTCDRMCPFCRRYCRKHYGHTNCEGDDALCQVDHGEIIVDSTMDIFVEVNCSTLPGAGLTCAEICSKAGRGHSHKQPQAELIRHSARAAEGQKDGKVRHTTFWRLLGFMDPHTSQEKELFDSCPYPCLRNDEHEIQVFCQGLLFHEPFIAVPTEKNGYIGHNRDGEQVMGHFFSCSEHLCLQDCSVLQRGQPCKEKCKLPLGHVQSLCDCRSGRHICGQPCTMTRMALCGNKCVRLVEESRHECCCDDRGCPKPCHFGCEGKKCVQKKHIHKLKEGEIHHCGKKHDCNNGCEDGGICCILDSGSLKQKEPPTAMVWQRHPDGVIQLKCCQQIAAGHPEHKGKHSCLREHTCDAKCPLCGRYCTELFGHPGEHKTHHGPVIDVQQLRILKSTGKEHCFDKDKDITCDQICADAGWGHEHKVQCLHSDHSQEGRRHDKANKDWVRHDLFWQTNGFCDPSPSDLIESLSSCPVVCPHPSHSSLSFTIHCSGKLGHKLFKMTDLNGLFKGKGGYVGHQRDQMLEHQGNQSVEGHHFICDNHGCGEMDHKCQVLNKSWQEPCQKVCSLCMGHQGSCDCCSGKHICRNKCAGTQCESTCVRHMEDPHSSNECCCEETRCLVKCEICKKEPCRMTTNHLHQTPDDTSFVHHCGIKHLCEDVCAEDGVCAIVPPGQEAADERFRKLTEGIDGVKLLCSINRDVGEVGHAGKHTCGRQHTCNKRCALCNHFCTQPLNHSGKCMAKHGPAIHLKDRQITETGRTVSLDVKLPCDQLCGLFCRGHKHIVPCSVAGRNSADRRSRQRRHSQAVNRAVLHGEFWATVNPTFCDPTAKENEDISFYDGCPAVCERCAETGKDVYCTGIAGHQAFKSLPGGYGGYISPLDKTKGHHFLCSEHQCLMQCTITSGWTRFFTCSGKCALPLGHPGKKCRCDAPTHVCGKDCSATPPCENKCTVDVSTAGKHRCVCDQKHCVAECDYEGCANTCSSEHAHSVERSEGEMVHYCGETHQCRGFCDADFMKGLCPLDTTSGRRKQVPGTANGYRGCCSLTVSVGQKCHEGMCRCKFSQEEHTCLKACPLCTRVCTLSYNHIASGESRHRTNHGHVAANILLTVCTALGDTVNLKNRRCDELCLEAGRGHTHTTGSKNPLPFDEDDWNVIGGEKLLLHTRFWASYSFHDPLQDHSQLLNGCPMVCSRQHDGVKPVYCTGQRWHSDIKIPHGGYLLRGRDQNKEMIHHFPCTGHRCDKDCGVEDNKRPCRRPCRKELGHENVSADHCDCQETHMCGKECSAKQCSCNCYLETGHDGQHICDAQSHCPSECGHCGKPCYSNHHVHKAREGDTLHHHCGGEHICKDSKYWQSEQPLCEVQNEANCRFLKLLPETGNPLRLPCLRTISQGQRAHSGIHCHSDDFDSQNPKSVIHYCNARCLMCGNCCTLPVGHDGLHDTKHGQVQYDGSDRWMVLPGDVGNIRDAKLRKVITKTQQKLSCFEVCKEAGRGHFHARPCSRAAGECQSIPGRCSHDDQFSVDLVTHATFWRRDNKFENKSSDIDKKMFVLCGMVCPQKDHKQQECSDQGTAGLCVGEVLHATISPGAASKDQECRYYKNGHAFECTHACDKKCRFHSTSRNCKVQCIKLLGHGGTCSCGTQEHLCNSFCEVKRFDAELCEQTCVFSCENHEVLTLETDKWRHKCSQKKCSHSCRKEGCNNNCDLGHFHVLDKTKTKHACKDHPLRTCSHYCQADGMCQILLADNERLVAWQEGCKVQNLRKGWKEPCTTSHTAGIHEGTQHRCKRAEHEHYCTAACPICGYFCHRQPVHHSGSHSTEHGLVPAGVVECILTASWEPVVLKKPTRCDEVCKLAGRGHYHQTKCQTPTFLSCEFLPECRLHLNGKNADIYTHSEFWKNVSFDDPCPSLTRLFSKCGEKCHGDEHVSSAEYCDLTCLHAPADSSTVVNPQPWPHGHLFSKCPHLCGEPCQQCTQKGRERHCQLLRGHYSSAHSCLQDPAEHDECWDTCPMCKNVCSVLKHGPLSTHTCVHGKVSVDASKRLIIFRYEGFIRGYTLIDSSDIQGKSCGDVCESFGENHRHALQACSGGKVCLKRQHAYVTHDKKGYDCVSHDAYWSHYGFTVPIGITGTGV